MLLSRMKNSLIFVVDKNPIHRNMVRFYLESKKWSNVESFPSGEECLYRLKRAPHPDFIITSFFTGNHSGFDLLKNIHPWLHLPGLFSSTPLRITICQKNCWRPGLAIAF